MDDYGNEYQDMDWFTGCTQYAYSVNTFGMFDDAAMDACIVGCIDYAAQDI